MRTFLLAGLLTLLPSWPTRVQPAATPAQMAQSLLDTDRGFAAAAARTDMVSALQAMFADGVMMPTPPGRFATGKAAVLAALRATPDAATSHVSWQPVRVGLSADGEQGFTFGYMTQHKADGSKVALKYMAYWVREGGAWRVLAYKRGRAAGPATDTVQIAPALPARVVPASRDAVAIAALRHELMRAEDAFSAEAQRIGLGNAFARHGSADAVNMGGAASAQFVVGASAIAAQVAGGDMTASPVTWGADTAFVASSGDLGITFGVIRANTPPPGAPAGPGSSFFTIWRRADVRSPWRYVAE